MSFPTLALALALERDVVALNGDPIAPQAWLAAAESRLWICWDGPLGADAPPRPACWTPVPRLDDLTGVSAAFVDPDTALLVDGSDLAWLLRRGASEVEEAPSDLALLGPLQPLVPLPCSHTGWLPTRDRGAWSWRQAPCMTWRPCTPPPKPRGRPSGIIVRLGLSTGWSVAFDRDLARVIGFDVVASLELGFDPARLRSQIDQRRSLARAEAPRGLPAPRTTGRVGASERDALARARCSAEVRP